MPEGSEPLRHPRFNHVALSVAAEALDQKGREEILRFYGEVFGWTEMPTLTEDRKQLVLRAYSNEQFVFLVADPEPMRCAGPEHFGLSVESEAKLDELLARARKFRERDPRVEIEAKKTNDFKVLKLHSFYLRHLLPMKIEVQCYEWAPGFDAQRTA